MVQYQQQQEVEANFRKPGLFCVLSRLIFFGRVFSFCILLASAVSISALAEEVTDEQTLLRELSKIIERGDLSDTNQMRNLLGLEADSDAHPNAGKRIDDKMRILDKSTIQYRPGVESSSGMTNSELVADVKAEACIPFSAWLRVIGPAVSSPGEGGEIQFTNDLRPDVREMKAQPAGVTVKGMLNSQNCVKRFHLIQTSSPREQRTETPSADSFNYMQTPYLARDATWIVTNPQTPAER